MTPQNYIPEGYNRIKVVSDLCSFLTTDFDPIANVVLYPRQLSGDFDTLAKVMAVYFGLDEKEIFIKYDEKEKIEVFKRTLNDSALIQCVDIILADMEFFQSGGVRCHMRVLTGYTEDSRTHKFHVDGLEQNFDRYMTCYNDPVTEYIKNDDVTEVVGHDVVYGDKAEVFQFRKGDIWKARVRNKPLNFIVDFIERKLKFKERRAFVHRAPLCNHPRLMVVGDFRLSK